jgi:hypothetical protein
MRSRVPLTRRIRIDVATRLSGRTVRTPSVPHHRNRPICRDVRNPVWALIALLDRAEPHVFSGSDVPGVADGREALITTRIEVEPRPLTTLELVLVPGLLGGVLWARTGDGGQAAKRDQADERNDESGREAPENRHHDSGDGDRASEGHTCPHCHEPESLGELLVGTHRDDASPHSLSAGPPWDRSRSPQRRCRHMACLPTARAAETWVRSSSHTCAASPTALAHSGIASRRADASPHLRFAVGRFGLALAPRA